MSEISAAIRAGLHTITAPDAIGPINQNNAVRRLVRRAYGAYLCAG